MQKELFAAAPLAAISDSFSQTRTPFLDKHRLTFRLDQALVLMIGLLVVYVLVFSFGVETGKRYSVAELRAERSKRERMTEELSRKIFEGQKSGFVTGGQAAQTPEVETKTLTPAIAASAAKPLPVSAKTIEGGAVAPVNVSAEPQKAQEGAKPAGKYTIQTVTVASKMTAERELKKLAAKGHKGFIIPAGKKLQICVDGFEAHSEASRAMRQLKSQHLIPADAYIRSLA